MKSVSVFACLAIAACAGTTIVDESGFTGIVPEPPADGIVALGLDGQTVAFADIADGRLPIAGSLYRSSDGPVQLWLTSIAGFNLSAVFPAGSSLAEAVPLSEVSYSTDISVAVPQDESISYGIGPNGGTARLTAITPQAGGYRLRGEFDTQICPDTADERDQPCYQLEGRFAFDEESLPEGADASAILLSGG